MATLVANPDLPKNETSEEESSHTAFDKNQDESSMINEGQLAWFDADFFVPPTEQIRQELKLSDKNLEPISASTMPDNKAAFVSKEIVKNVNGVEEVDEQNQIEQASEYQVENLAKANDNLLGLELPDLVQDSAFQNQVAQAISRNLTKEITTKSEIVKPSENLEKVENTQVQSVINNYESPVTPNIESLSDFEPSDKN